MKNDKYINIWDYEDERCPLQIVVSVRGDGKTYSGLWGLLDKAENEGSKFLYMRRTDKEMKMVIDNRKYGEMANPFKKINKARGTNYGILPSTGDTGIICERVYDEKGKIIDVKEKVGYAFSLMSLASIRGVDLTDCDYWIYDEFIPERHVRKITGEGEAFINAIETIARNRESEGQKPMKIFLLANAFNIYNPIFVSLGIVNIAERMISRKQEHKQIPERVLGLHFPAMPDRLKEEKTKSFIGMLTEGTAYHDMAFDNDFVYNDFSYVEYRNVKNHTPVCSLDKDIFIWKNRTNGTFYITYTKGQCRNFNIKSSSDVLLFRRVMGTILKDSYALGRIYFENYNLKEIILELIKIL